jgi:succinate dehydrogenase cytochrome b556 subunit
MWTWVLHRITGVSVFFFLLVHVLDTALVRVSPEAYDLVIASYKTPIVNLLEVGLVGAVLYHALNGLRVILVDFWAKAPLPAADDMGHRRGLSSDAPGTYFMLKHTVEAMFGSTSEHHEPVRPRQHPAPRSGARNGQRSNFELYSWLFMRISGIVLIFLVLGHLLIMNVLDGGVQRINFAFVAGRWSSPFWQVWDLLMLWLAMIHGTNGMRTIIMTTPSATRRASG